MTAVRIHITTFLSISAIAACMAMAYQCNNILSSKLLVAVAVISSLLFIKNTSKTEVQ